MPSVPIEIKIRIVEAYQSGRSGNLKETAAIFGMEPTGGVRRQRQGATARRNQSFQ